jgi:hypothetical protein
MGRMLSLMALFLLAELELRADEPKNVIGLSYGEHEHQVLDKEKK